MLQESGREQAPITAQPVTWFVPDRPVGGTVFVRPAAAQVESHGTSSTTSADNDD
jgi:hypothetical protein